MLIPNLLEKIREECNEKYFRKINETKLQTYFNSLFENVHNETIILDNYMTKKIDEFPGLFESNLNTLSEVIHFLEKTAIPNNCECSEIIDIIPCWRCLDCTDYDCIYCSKCFLKSKDLHKGHKIHFLPDVEGMCDCGNPSSYETFCPEHKGPFIEQKQIDEFIEKSFPPNTLKKLKIFFDDLFSKFSKYLILTESCNFFCEEIYLYNFHNKREQEDVLNLKENFCIVFQNFITFLYLITNKNMGMLYLITNYILKNHFSENIDEKYKTNHSCIKIENKKIQIIYEDTSSNKNNDIFSLIDINAKDKHNCKCSFLRLLLSNWRKEIISNEENQNEKLLVSFTHNTFLKEDFATLYFFLYKYIMLNNNYDVISLDCQYISEENILLLIGKQTNLIENSFYHCYNYIKDILNNLYKLPEFKTYLMNRILEVLMNVNRFKYFNKPKIREVINYNVNLIKTFVDIICLLHNQCEYESIMPHPPFQEKSFSSELLEFEFYSINLFGEINLCYDWEEETKAKEFFDYLVNKILNQKSQGIKQLKNNEFSFHLTLYRFFGLFLNYFSINYALKNNKNLIDSIEYIKTKLFKSKEEMQKVIDLIIEDYLKMYGFIIGIRSGFFNYYENLSNYNEDYFNDLKILKADFTLLKYLLSLSEKKINLDYILEKSNIEYTYSFFKRIFKENKKDFQSEDKKQNNNDTGVKKSYLNNSNDKPNDYYLNNIELYKDIMIMNKEDEAKEKEIYEDYKKFVIQWVRIIEIVIYLMKNDSTYFWCFLTSCEKIYSFKIKKKLFDKIKQNSKIMLDLRNNLKEKMIRIFICHGNWLELPRLKSLVDEYYFILFNEKEFNEILDEITIIKKSNRKNIICLKDSSFRYLDMNFFFSPLIKSKAEIYISDFKKDSFKLFNSYFYKPSTLSFEFNNKVFENILHSIESLKLIIKILEKLTCQLNNEKDSKYINHIRSAFLPLILNYLTMLGTLNSRSFIKFKLENQNILNKICDLLDKSIQNNDNNTIYDNDLSENVLNTIKQLNKYKIINDKIKGDLTKLDEFDYNIEDIIIEKDDLNKEKSLNKNHNTESKNKSSLKEKKSKLKEKYKKLIAQKGNKFIDKIKDNKALNDILKKEDNKNSEDGENEIMCFLCRNNINLNSFKEPYGKIGYINRDLFFQNSIKSSIKEEINKIVKKNEEDQKNINSIEKEKGNKLQAKTRIISCGHYFHQKCFNDGLNEYNSIKCPVCEKYGNVLIAPLTNFYGKQKLLISEKLDNILDKKSQLQKFEIKEENLVFKNICLDYIQYFVNNSKNIKKHSIDYNFILNEIFPNFECCINYLWNIFYYDATTFFKQEQIDSIKNMILSLRYLTRINCIDINQIKNYILNGIELLIKGPSEKDDIINNYKESFYDKYITKILFSFVILLDYNEFTELFLYAINLTLPYYFFWLYLRNLIVENHLYSFYNEKMKDKININNYKQYLKDNNSKINEYFKLFLNKFLIIKIITNYNNEKSIKLNKKINDLTMEEIFTELRIQNLYDKSKNENNEINYTKIFEIISNKLNSSSSTIKDCIIPDSDKIVTLLINNLVKLKEEKYIMNERFFYQFNLYKFDLIKLEDNIFDFIEKYLFKKCYACSTYKKLNYVCLICGNKMCQDEIIEHIFKCTLSDIIFIEMKTMKLIYFHHFKSFRLSYTLYTNEFGGGPSDNFISKEFILNKENYKYILRNYICLDFHQ